MNPLLAIVSITLLLFLKHYLVLNFYSRFLIDMLTLERSHRLCLKQMQALRSRSRTDIVLCLLCTLPLATEIEKRKLVFLGQLYRLERDCAAKRLFLLRLSLFKNGSPDFGFNSDVVSLLHKYKIYNSLEDYLAYGDFPGRYSWKHCINIRFVTTI